MKGRSNSDKPILKKKDKSKNQEFDFDHQNYILNRHSKKALWNYVLNY
jgi:hypothetical protein